MSFTKTFPLDIGTFVIVDHKDLNLDNPRALLNHLGTIACYQCVDTSDDMIVMVSGYKSAWCGEYLLTEVLVATDEQVRQYELLMGIKPSK